MENVVEKIRKLLALAGGENDHEAHAAMLKARELMARHKLTEKDIPQEQKAGNLVKEPYSEQSFSNVKNWWFMPLADVIAENHCCTRAALSLGPSSLFILFVGLDDDPRIACEIFGYAVQYIQRKAADYKTFLKNHIQNIKERNRAAREWEYSYAAAFAKGLGDQYAEQFKGKESKSMALALVLPVEVTQYAVGLKRKSIKVREQDHNAFAARQGYSDGYTFNPVKQIPSE